MGMSHFSSGKGTERSPWPEPRRSQTMRRGKPSLPRRKRNHARLVKAGGDAAHDYRASAAERRSVRPGDVSVSCQFQNAELLGQQTAIAIFDGLFGPLMNVGGPHWRSMAGDLRMATKRAVRPMAVCKDSR